MPGRSRQRDGAWLIYGAYGFTGRLVAERAIAAGMEPVLAGRDAARLGEVARELGCGQRVLTLDDAAALRKALARVDVVAHCAGPFSRTAGPMVQACLDAGAHYLDITGELGVLDAILERDAEARAAGVALLPGAGFDVVPTDCLAALAAAELEGAARAVEIAFLSRGGVSGGTLRTAAENIGQPTLRRRSGRLEPVPRSERRREIEYVTTTAGSNAISWGDLATAPRSTGASDVTVYTAVPPVADVAMQVAAAAVRLPGVRPLLQPLLSRAAGRVSGPAEEALERAGCELWVRVTGEDGSAVERRMTTPNAYALTADAVVRIVERLLDGRVQPGAHTPSAALGAEFVLGLDGVQLH